MTFPRAVTAATLDELRRVLRYEPETGCLFWLVSCGRSRAGNQAGCLGPNGYIRICYRGRFYTAHRLAFLLMTGDAPIQIDHRNLNRSDNRWTNLRAATAFQNAANVPGRRAPGTKGVIRDRKRFKAEIRAEGKLHRLGVFDTTSEAHEAYCAAAVRLHGEFARFE